MPELLTPDDVVAAAVTAEAALRPVTGRDWSVRAGPLDWDGLGTAFTPPADLCQRVLAQQFPAAAGPGNAWYGLLTANGRPIR